MSGTELSREEILRYSRHLIIPEVTIAGQRKLKDAKVLCVGAGGLGSPLALYLAAAGVGTIGIVEFDTVDLTNLQRQILYSNADVGRPKLEAAKQRLEELNPDIRINPHAARLTSSNVLGLFAEYDIIADGSDNFPTRYLVNDACVLLGKPDVYASIFRFDGQLTVFDARRGPCYRCMMPEPPPPNRVPSCAEGGVLGALPGILGSLQALEVLKLILGIGDPLIGRFVLFDALGFSFDEIGIEKDPDCAVCGDHPTVTEPIDYEEFCQIRGEEGETSGGDVPLVSAEEVKRRLDIGEHINLVDVRETFEREIVAIPGSMSIPLSELPSRLHEFDSAENYVLYCHGTLTSVRAYDLLHTAGFERLEVLVGGVDAWAERIDTILPRY